MAAAAKPGKGAARSTTMRRIMSEVAEMSALNDPDISAAPVEDELFEWHFTIRGPPGTAFEGGMYHGRILLPSDYPHRPPDIVMLTPSGRFATNVKICLSITGYHPKSWQPSWGIRTALVALRAFMVSRSKGAIGGLDYSDEERRKLASKSRKWRCGVCDLCNAEQLPEATGEPEEVKAVNEDEDEDEEDAVEEEVEVDGEREEDRGPDDGARERRLPPEMDAPPDLVAPLAAAAGAHGAAAPAPAPAPVTQRSAFDTFLSLLTVAVALAVCVLLARRVYRRSHELVGTEL